MGKGHKMRIVVEACDKYVTSAEFNEFYLEGNEHFYLGHETIDQDGTILTWYFCPQSETESLIFLYIGDDCFDELLRNLDENNVQAVCNAWPLFMEASKHGSDDNYSAPALIKLRHTEVSGGTLGCLALKIESVDLTDPDQRVSACINGKFKVLIEYFYTLNNQFSNNDISKLDLIKGGVIHGFNTVRTINVPRGVVSALLGIPLSIGGDE